jgi:hypothetical protein
MRDEGASGVLPIIHDGEPPTVDQGCHQIIDAATALAANVEVLSEMTANLAETEPVVADVRASLDRIVNVARALRAR